MVQPPKPPPIILIAPVESIADVEDAPLFANQLGTKADDKIWRKFTYRFKIIQGCRRIKFREIVWRAMWVFSYEAAALFASGANFLILPILPFAPSRRAIFSGENSGNLQSTVRHSLISDSGRYIFMVKFAPS